jgi:hypothetical protein
MLMKCIKNRKHNQDMKHMWVHRSWLWQCIYLFHCSSFQLKERKVNPYVAYVLYMCATLFLFRKGIVFIISKIVINGYNIYCEPHMKSHIIGIMEVGLLIIPCCICCSVWHSCVFYAHEIIKQYYKGEAYGRLAFSICWSFVICGC